MKRTFYIFIMMILSNIITFLTYFAMLVLLVRHGIVERRDVLWITDMTMSCEAYLLVAILACVIGYLFAKKWWQIIYVDGVYYFDKTKMPKKRKMQAE
jgi:hypothetical protein